LLEKLDEDFYVGRVGATHRQEKGFTRITETLDQAETEFTLLNVTLQPCTFSASDVNQMLFIKGFLGFDV